MQIQQPIDILALRAGLKTCVFVFSSAFTATIIKKSRKKEYETEELKSLWQFLDTKLFLEVTTEIMHKPTPSWKHFISLN